MSLALSDFCCQMLRHWSFGLCWLCEHLWLDLHHFSSQLFLKGACEVSNLTKVQLENSCY